MQPKATIRLLGGDPTEIDKRVADINAFIKDPELGSVRFTHNNRTMLLTFAALMVIAAAVLTHDFSYRPWRSR